MREKQVEGRVRRGSILDIFLVFLILLSILGVLLRRQELKRYDTTQTMNSYIVTAVFEGIDPEVAKCVTLGEALYTRGGDYYGQISDIEVRPSRFGFFSDGKYYSDVWDIAVKCDLYVDVLFEGSKNENTVLWHGRQALLCGQQLELCAERAVLRLKILKINDQNS